MMKKGILWILLFSFVLCLTGCSCTHEWEDATCQSDRKCMLCGEVMEYSVLMHTWQDATCETPKMCEVCGLTEGEAIHHNYVKNYCEHCGEIDPTAFDLNQFGFLNNDGMNCWLRVFYYDYDLSYVVFSGFEIFEFYDKYFQSDCPFNVDNKGVYTTNYSDSERKYINPADYTWEEIKEQCVWDKELYKTFSNEDISYNWRYRYTIIERIVCEDRVAIECLNQDGVGRCFVPVDLLDISTCRDYELNDTTYIRIDFK